MEKRHGSWYLISMASAPLLFLARAGLFGRQAQEEAEVALQDWSGYGAAILSLLAMVALAVILVLLYRLVA